MITPPVGIGIYVMMGVGKIKYEELMRACGPFFLSLTVCLLIVTYVLSISLWLRGSRSKARFAPR